MTDVRDLAERVICPACGKQAGWHVPRDNVERVAILSGVDVEEAKAEIFDFPIIECRPCGHTFSYDDRRKVEIS